MGLCCVCVCVFVCMHARADVQTCILVCVCVCAFLFKMYYISLSYSSVDNWFGEIVLSVCGSGGLLSHSLRFHLSLSLSLFLFLTLQCFIDKPISVLPAFYSLFHTEKCFTRS